MNCIVQSGLKMAGDANCEAIQPWHFDKQARELATCSWDFQSVVWGVQSWCMFLVIFLPMRRNLGDAGAKLQITQKHCSAAQGPLPPSTTDLVGVGLDVSA